LIDTDVAWEIKPGEPYSEPRREDVVGVVERLHEPAEAVFEAAITNRLREEVLNHD
jgi:uncharacterized protein (TIGR04255 family)